LINLIYNEMVKLAGKKRIVVILAIIAILVSLFTYAQYKEAEETRQRYGSVDWRTVLEQRIGSWENRMNASRTSEESRQELALRIAQQQYYLDYDVNPAEPGAPTFVREFVKSGASLLFPLLVMVVASDLVSSEHSGGTVKMLLTRPVRRWRILASKYVTLVLCVSLIITAFGVLSLVIAGGVFGFRGWNAPVLTGFAVHAGEIGAPAVRFIPQWEYLLMQFGLAWFVSMAVATLSFMLSVLIRSTAAGMGIMLACLISGMILQGMVESWEGAKYLFMVNLDLQAYLENASPPVEGMTLGFSLAILLAWAAAGAAVSWGVFTRRDMY
jgi:ABC-2 type transport system permease protein